MEIIIQHIAVPIAAALCVAIFTNPNSYKSWNDAPGSTDSCAFFLGLFFGMICLGVPINLYLESFKDGLIVTVLMIISSLISRFLCKKEERKETKRLKSKNSSLL